MILCGITDVTILWNMNLRKLFGQEIYKLFSNGNMSCPNRDGTHDTRRCIFCREGGSGDFVSSKILSISEQIVNRLGGVILKYYVTLNQEEIMDFINTLNTILKNENFIVCARIILAILCGGVIGLERGRSNQPAGMRTYMLVCLGATLVMLTAKYIYIHFHTGDPSRLGAQVISGIGFLGAGSIIISGKTKVRGLTTAAGLWVSACIGIAIGIGFYSGGILTTVAVYFIMSKFRKLEDKLTHNGTWFKFYVEFNEIAGILVFKNAIEGFGLELSDIQINSSLQKDFCSAVVTIKNCQNKKSVNIFDYLKSIEGIGEIKSVV